LYEGSQQLGGTISVDGSGSWQVMLPFSEGTHAIRAKSLVANTLGDASAARTFTVDASPPTVHITRPSGYLLAQFVLPGESMTVSGSATDRIGVARIDVTYTDVLTGTTTTQTATCSACPGGNVAWTATATLPFGLYDVVAVAYDGVGNSSASDSILVLNLNP
jgi:hypothetical protein